MAEFEACEEAGPGVVCLPHLINSIGVNYLYNKITSSGCRYAPYPGDKSRTGVYTHSPKHTQTHTHQARTRRSLAHDPSFIFRSSTIRYSLAQSEPRSRQHKRRWVINHDLSCMSACYLIQCLWCVQYWVTAYQSTKFIVVVVCTCRRCIPHCSLCK